MARINIRRDIEIKRNPIEKALMKIKEFFSKNSKSVLYVFLGIIALLIITFPVVIYIDSVANRQQVQFEQIMETYHANAGAEGEENNQKAKETIASLKKLVDSSHFGYAHTQGYYVLGNLYYSEKMYKEAKEALLTYVDKAPDDSVFAAAALLKAGIAAEEAGDIDGALKILKKMEEDKNFSKSVVADQLNYHLARLYAKKGDAFKAREYFNIVVNTYGMSPYAEMAKKHLFTLGGKTGL